MILQMDKEDFTEMMENAEKFKISSFQTDREQEKINILANSYVYSFCEPHFSVVSNKDPIEFREDILRRINTEKIMGVKLINIMEAKHNINLDELKVDY